MNNKRHSRLRREQALRRWVKQRQARLQFIGVLSHGDFCDYNALNVHKPKDACT